MIHIKPASHSSVHFSLHPQLVRTNQFSVTKHHKGVNPWAGGSGLPGVFFMYDLSPMMVQITEHRRSFFHFLTGVCAIVGGVFTGEHMPVQTGTAHASHELTLRLC